MNEGERLEILRSEMELLQSRFDKYDDLIFRNRGWMVTIIVALLGAAITLHQLDLATLAAAVALLFYLVEVVWRFNYWHKYVTRYRFIRDWLYNKRPIDDLWLYDLTHKYGLPVPWWKRLKECSVRFEVMFFYGSLAGGSILLRYLLNRLVAAQGPLAPSGLGPFH